MVVALPSGWASPAALFLILLTSLQENAPKEARELIEQLRSEKIEDRESAIGRLKALGAAALPELERASRDRDPEVSGRARHVIRAIEVMKRLTPNVTKAVPGVEDRLAVGAGHTWTEVFLELSDRGRQRELGLKREDLECLAVPALEAAKSAQEKQILCERAIRHRLTRVAPKIAGWMRDEDIGTRMDRGRSGSRPPRACVSAGSLMGSRLSWPLPERIRPCGSRR